MSGLLIAGGKGDPNLGWLHAAAERQGISTIAVLVDPAAPPEFKWAPVAGNAVVDGVELDCGSAFLRYDVFSGLADGEPQAAIAASAWYATFAGFCIAAGMFTFNRDIDMVSASKPAMLVLAAAEGLAVPPTLISNSQVALGELAPEDHIAKPVAGGSYVMELGPALTQTSWAVGASPAPAIVQSRLAYPERRVYRIGKSYFAFDIGSRTTDSRLDGNCVITPVDDVDGATMEGIARLTDRIHCDFCAIDLKTDPQTGGLAFLELNNSPMFVGYDRTCDGAMAEAMARYLAAAAT